MVVDFFMNKEVIKLKQLFGSVYLLILVLLSVIGFWIVSAAYDHFILEKGGFFDCLLITASDLVSMPYNAALVGIGIAVLGQFLANRISQRNQLRTLFEKSSDGIMLIRARDGVIVKANARATRLLLYQEEELVGLSIADIHPHDYEIAADFIDRVIKVGEGITDQVSCRTKIGGLIPAEVSASAFNFGKTGYILVNIRDITERVASRNALQRSLEEMERANRYKNEFMANMSHELRTPLNAIIGFSDMIAAERLGPQATVTYREYAHDIQKSGQHLLDLVNDILDLSAIESGNDDLVEIRVNAASVVESSIRLLREQADSKGVELNAECPADLPLLFADLRKMRQILINLVSNAIKFTEAGGKVSVQCFLEAEGGMVFRVSDTGIGMAPEDIPTALTTFQQIDGELNRKYEGSGLGLPLTKLLVEQHHGSLKIASKPGEGTTVTAIFPQSRLIMDEPDTAERIVTTR